MFVCTGDGLRWKCTDVFACTSYMCRGGAAYWPGRVDQQTSRGTTMKLVGLSRWRDTLVVEMAPTTHGDLARKMASGVVYGQLIRGN